MALTGLLDIGTLMAIPSQPSLRLTADVAAAWEVLADDVLAHFGWRPRLTDAYRSYAEQEALFRARYTTTPLPGRPTKTWQGRTWWLRYGQATAAVPGTSNHGLGDTVDVAGLGGIGDFTSAAYREFASRATVHGWSNKEGSKIGEPWHWQRVTDTAPTTTTSEEDDMTPEQATMLGDILWAVEQIRSTDLPPIAKHAYGANASADLAAAAASGPVLNGVKALLARAGADVDEQALAAELVPLLAEVTRTLSDDDLGRIATAAADEQDRRARARLAG